MSERENLISRWSRLKRESESPRKHESERRESAAPSSAAVTSAANEGEIIAAKTRARPTLDLATLPSIDSITAGTDVSVFLQSGVPAKLTEAALRRAWVSDPVIRDFIGIAENQWDFTNPATILGFGPLQDTGDKLSFVIETAGILDNSSDEFSARPPDTHASAEKTRSATVDSRHDAIEDTSRETPVGAATRTDDGGTVNAAAEHGRVEAAAQNNLSPGNTNPQRRRHAHGGALPR